MSVTPLSTSAASGRILIVDDESTIRSAGASVLQHLGYTVDTAENGKRCLEMIEEKAGAYDAVLLDLAMPVLDGTATLKVIREKHPALPVLLMSGYLSERLDHLLQEGSPTAVIQKPFSLTDLSEGLAKLLKL
ncbi:MAG: hybrid sensor histidine kinase/response regulator [Verrucomicrobiaceae bacterium]|nr:hybrid sensor histidine kinase/response regulator [Verrucomicrobiaceae bacterium]